MTQKLITYKDDYDDVYTKVALHCYKEKISIGTFLLILANEFFKKEEKNG